MQEIYNGVVKLINQLIRSCKDAASLCQQWYLNGYKRYYQMDVLWYMEKLLYLKKKVFDMYHFMPLDNNESESYRPQGYKDHFSQWKRFLQSTIDTLTGYNKKLFNETGIENCTITEILCHLYKDQERLVRDIAQYNESSWNPIEIHAKDKKLHSKMKKKMKKEGVK